MVNDKHLGYCMICREDNIEVRHISLYVIGSEGLVVCHSCEMRLVEFVRSLMRETSVRKLQNHLRPETPEPPDEKYPDIGEIETMLDLPKGWFSRGAPE